MKDLRTEIENVLWQNDSSPDLVMYRTRVLDALLPLFQQHMEAVAVKVEEDIGGKIPWQAVNFHDSCPKCGQETNVEYVDLKFSEARDAALIRAAKIIRAAKNN